VTRRGSNTANAIPFRSAAEIEAALDVAVTHLRRHGVLAYPTETVYGFGGAVDRESVNALLELKGRDVAKRFLLLIDGLPMVTRLGLRLEGPAREIALRHWPGPLTLVLPGGVDGLPEELRGGKTAITARTAGSSGAGRGGVAVRWTSHVGITRLLEAYDGPITSTSANRTGVPPAMSTEEIGTEWGDAISRGTLVVLDGGRLEPSAPSTVVDCTSQPPRVIREGAIPPRVLRETVPDLGDV
jgi:L-threonylcarbamoyladenylate synthase